MIFAAAAGMVKLRECVMFSQSRATDERRNADPVRH